MVEWVDSVGCLNVNSRETKNTGLGLAAGHLSLGHFFPTVYFLLALSALLSMAVSPKPGFWLPRQLVQKALTHLPSLPLTYMEVAPKALFPHPCQAVFLDPSSWPERALPISSLPWGTRHLVLAFLEIVSELQICNAPLIGTVRLSWEQCTTPSCSYTWTCLSLFVFPFSSSSHSYPGGFWVVCLCCSSEHPVGLTGQETVL